MMLRTLAVAAAFCASSTEAFTLSRPTLAVRFFPVDIHDNSHFMGLVFLAHLNST